jgi:hypothetical protein
MEGTTVEALFKTILPYESIKAAANRLGVVKRDRYLDPMTLVLSLVLNGGTAEAGRIAAALRDYVDRGGREVARSWSYTRRTSHLATSRRLLCPRRQRPQLAKQAQSNRRCQRPERCGPSSTKTRYQTPISERKDALSDQTCVRLRHL